MAEFSVILEDVVKTERKRGARLDISNRRVVTIEANNIDDAWIQARKKWYTLKADGPDTQIVDIEEGVVELDNEKPPEVEP